MKLWYGDSPSLCCIFKPNHSSKRAGLGLQAATSLLCVDEERRKKGNWEEGDRVHSSVILMQTCTAFFQLPDKTTTYGDFPATSWVLKCRYVSVHARADEEKDGWSYARLRWKKRNEMSTFIRSTSTLPLAGSQNRKKIKGFSNCAKTLRRVRELLALMGKLISDGSRKRRSVRKEGWKLK